MIVSLKMKEELRRFVTENRGTLITADVRTCMDSKISLVLNSCPAGWNACGNSVSVDVSSEEEGRKLFWMLRDEFPDAVILLQ